MPEPTLSNEEQAKQEIAALVAQAYLDSKDFNGIPESQLPLASHPLVRALIADGEIYANFGHRMSNPFILGFSQESAEENVAEVGRRGGLAGAVLYPTRRYLRDAGAGGALRQEPYTRALALGHGQLEPRFFEPAVLSKYRDDPLYEYAFDIDGYIRGTGDRSAYLTTISVGFDRDSQSDEIVIGVPLRYLRDLDSKEQGYWHSFELSEQRGWVLHPDFIRPHFLGEFPEKISPFAAIIWEMEAVNELCAAAGFPLLYRKTFRNGSRPTDFGYLIRPTTGELNNFVEQLNKMLIDNMNVKFFEGQVATSETKTDSNGAEYSAPRGTVAMLNDWMLKIVCDDRHGLIPAASTTLRAIRKVRSSAAHAIKVNEHDVTVWAEQRKYTVGSYLAVRTIRQILQAHPKVSGVSISPMLDENKVWDF